MTICTARSWIALLRVASIKYVSRFQIQTYRLMLAATMRLGD